MFAIDYVCLYIQIETCKKWMSREMENQIELSGQTLVELVDTFPNPH